MFSELPPIKDHRRHAACVRPNRSLQSPFVRPTRYGTCSWGQPTLDPWSIMSATKILWGQIVIVFAIVLATIWAATQWVAWKLGYQPQLGHPWFELISGVPIYFPPAFFWWWYAYDAYAPHVFVEGAYIASSGGFISIAVAIGMSLWRAREANTPATHGSARW